jgi:site-specific recombinase XerC
VTVLAEAGMVDALLRDLRHLDARAASDLADWLVHLDLEGKSDRTLYEYQRKVAPLLRANPEKTLAELTHTDINNALRGIPERSRYISRSIYNSWFSWAYIDERIDRNPVEKVARMRQAKRRPKDIYSDTEVELLESLPSPDGALWSILFGAGLRRGEARRLKREHISLTRRRLMVYGGKGDKDRVVPIPARVLTAVADLDLIEGLNPEDYMWYTLRGQGRMRWRKTAMGDSTFDRWYRRCLEDAGITRYLNPHQTRHTFGHRLREADFSLEERKVLMGHEKIATTDYYYGTLTIEDVALKVDRL